MALIRKSSNTYQRRPDRDDRLRFYARDFELYDWKNSQTDILNVHMRTWLCLEQKKFIDTQLVTGTFARSRRFCEAEGAMKKCNKIALIKLCTAVWDIDASCICGQSMPFLTESMYQNLGCWGSLSTPIAFHFEWFSVVGAESSCWCRLSAEKGCASVVP